MKGQKAILIFLVKFVGLYLVLNTAYAFWADRYKPEADPLTRVVTHQTTTILNWFEDGVSVGESFNSANVPIRQDNRTIVSVFEGCNSINVIVVFLSFVIAFAGSWTKTSVFIVLGAMLIYLCNLGRVVLLFFVAKYYPNNLYFFHKYLFTAVLYGVVFILWFIWVKKIWPSQS